MMPPPDSEMIAPLHNGMIPPGVICGLAGAAVGLIRSPLWQPQRRIDASGADQDARCARDYSAEVFVGIDRHEIARRLGLARSTVRETLKRVDGAGLSWPLSRGDERRGAGGGALRQPTQQAAIGGSRNRTGPTCIANERKHVTLLILWDEYIAANPGGYSCCFQFCELCRSFEEDAVGDDAPDARRRRAAVRRLRRRRRSGRHRSAHRQRSAWRRSSSPCWGHRLHLRQGDLDAGAARLDRRPCARLQAIGGVPELVVPDNARTAIVKASFYRS